MENKKPDLRDQVKDKISPTDNHAQMAGEKDRAAPLKPQSDMHELTPEIGKHLAEGQVTKSS